MKKRVLSAIALTMVLSMTFGMTAFASSNSSVETDEVKSEALTFDPIAAGNPTVSEEEKAALDKEAGALLAVITGKPENATLTNLTAAELKDAKTIAAMVASFNGVANANIDVLAGADITITGFTGGTFTITLSRPIDPNAKLIILHLNETNNTWEPLTVVNISEDGKTITLYASSLSPVVIAEAKAGETSEESSEESESTPAVSPKTGAVASVAGIMAAVCLAGAAVSAKKVREEN